MKPTRIMPLRRLLSVCAALTLGGLCVSAGHAQDPSGPVAVKFHEPKFETANLVEPVVGPPRIQIQYTGGMAFGLTIDKQIRLCFSAGSIYTTFKIDDRIVGANTPAAGRPLPPTPQGKQRIGQETSFDSGKVRITQVLEVVPSKPTKAGDKRMLDTLLIRYIFENKDTVPHKVATRVRIDTMCGNNDGALFAAPTTHPKQILDGIELKGKMLPDFVQILENPNLDNPGFVGHFTLKMTGKLIGPDRFICTQHGAAEVNGWDVMAQQAMGDSDCALYWPTHEVPPGGKIEMAYGYGKGLAVMPESEGKVSVALGGSFEPGKLFTITASVEDPVPGQALTLELPAGMDLVEGRVLQPVPTPADGLGASLVLWKGRVVQMGDFTIRIHASNGVTVSRRITIAPATGQ